MNKTIFTLIIISLVSTNLLKACSCINVPDTFSKNIQAEHVIFSGTILEHIEFPNDSNHLIMYHGLTKIKVDKWYQNKMKSDTIYYANGQGAMCENSIDYLGIGDQVVLKAVQGKVYRPSFEFYNNIDEKLMNFLKHFKVLPTVRYNICDVSILLIKDELVIGNITKNDYANNMKFIRFAGRISKKIADHLYTKQRHFKYKFQEWSLEKFERLMRRKCKFL